MMQLVNEENDLPLRCLISLGPPSSDLQTRPDTLRREH